MGPLQVLYDTIDEPLYDGQMCLAEFILRILFGKFCLSITPQWLNTEIPDIVWQVLRDDPSVVPSGGWVCRRPRRRSVDKDVYYL